jgi:hypothetical protein
VGGGALAGRGGGVEQDADAADRGDVLGLAVAIEIAEGASEAPKKGASNEPAVAGRVGSPARSPSPAQKGAPSWLSSRELPSRPSRTTGPAVPKIATVSSPPGTPSRSASAGAPGVPVATVGSSPETSSGRARQRGGRAARVVVAVACTA